MSKIDLSKVNTYSQLSNTLHDFERAGKIISVKGNSVTIGANQLNINELKSRIEDVYTDLKSLEKMDLVQYSELNNLFFEIQSLSARDSRTIKLFQNLFLGDDTMRSIENECRQKIHENREFMETVLEQYDKLAAIYNQSIKEGVQAHELEETFKLLKYLNSIVGLEWSADQLQGGRQLPLWKEHTAEGNSIPQSLKVEDCNRLSSLNALLIYLNQHERAGRYRDKLVIPGMGEFPFAVIEKKIMDLYKNEISRFPFAKAEIAYEAVVAIDLLERINPRSTTTKSPLNKVVVDCLSAIRQDPQRMKIVKKRYNQLARSANEEMLQNLKYEESNNTVSDNFVIDIKLAAKILGIPLTIEHYNRRALIPLKVNQGQKMNVSDFARYNTYRSLINRELELREKLKELKVLNWQIDPNNVSSILLKSSQNDEISEKREQIVNWICDKFIDVNASEAHYTLRSRLESYQMPEPLFQSMLTACANMAERAGKPLKENELNGTAYLPRLDYQLSINRENFFQKIDDANKINMMIDKINTHIKLRKLFAKLEELRSKIRLDNTFVKFQEDILDDMSAVEAEISALKNSSKNILEKFTNDRALILYMEKTFIPFYKILGPGTLSKSQMNGLDEIPLIDLDQLDLPNNEALLRAYNDFPIRERQWIKLPQKVKDALAEARGEIAAQPEEISSEASTSGSSMEEASPVAIEPLTEFESKIADADDVVVSSATISDDVVSKLKNDLLSLRFRKLDTGLKEDPKGKDGIRSGYETLSISILHDLNRLFSENNVKGSLETIEFIKTKLHLEPSEQMQVLHLLYSNMNDADFEALMEELQLTDEPWLAPITNTTTELERSLQLRLQLLEIPAVPKSFPQQEPPSKTSPIKA